MLLTSLNPIDTCVAQFKLITCVMLQFELALLQFKLALLLKSAYKNGLQFK